MAVTNHFNALDDCVYLAARGASQKPIFKCSFLYKASPCPINTSVLQEVWFIITLSFMQWAGACSGPHCIHCASQAGIL